jgi:hypothetical protein
VPHFCGQESNKIRGINVKNLQFKESRTVYVEVIAYAETGSAIGANIRQLKPETANDSQVENLATVDEEVSNLSEFERARRTSKTWSMGQD